MKHLLLRWRIAAGVLTAAMLCAGFVVPQTAYAGTTGNISGTVTDASGKPLADVSVSAASVSQSAHGVTDARGFYSLVNLTPDTYTVSYQKTGFQPLSVPGIAVFQDQTLTLNQKLQTQLKTIASVHAAGGSNLVKSNQGSDVYTVSGKQLTAATNPVDTHETLYQYLAVTPGVTTTGFPGQPRVRGGQVSDLGYEFDGIPIQDRITGFFTSNLANIGVSNVEVYTGGLPASGSANGTGYLNSVVKTGTYPAYTQVSLQFTSPEANHYITLEHGWATPDHKFSGYIGFDGVNSQNQYGYGEHTYPDVLFYGYNGPGPVKTRDWVGNFIYRPSQSDAVQFLLTNSLGEFDYNYLLQKNAGEPPAMAFTPCPGAVNDPTTKTGASGGIAPNGQTCPNGLYFSSIPNGGGNMWHHYGGLGKIQWNHNVNDHSFFDLRFAENFNQYIFDQPLADPNIPNLENAGDPYNWAQALGQPASACPTYPIATGSPVMGFTTNKGRKELCAFDNGPEVFWGDRHSNMYFGNIDYTNELNAHLTLKAGASHEIDNNVFNYFLTEYFNGGTAGTPAQWPDNYLRSIYPTVRDSVYGTADIHTGKFLFSPGLLYAQQRYDCPTSGCTTVHILNPTFNGTYSFNPDNVVRFSYGDSASFVGSGYVYRQGSSFYNPDTAGFTYEPQINHSADLMFEHQFADNTSLRFGPWMNSTSNYFEQYTPIVGTNPNGTPKFGPSVLSNGQRHHAFGLEFALNHVDNRPVGISYWLSGTYDNYWTTSTYLQSAFVNAPLPQNIVNQGIEVRAFANPLWNGSLLADFHSDRFHLDPMAVFSTDYYYNVGVTCNKDANGNSVPAFLCQNEKIAGANWYMKLVAYEELGPKRNYVVGVRADNLLDNTNDVAPCTSYGTGCFPFDGPESGVTTAPGVGTDIYQNYSQGPRTIYFFAGVKF